MCLVFAQLPLSRLSLSVLFCSHPSYYPALALSLIEPPNTQTRPLKKTAHHQQTIPNQHLIQNQLYIISRHIVIIFLSVFHSCNIITILAQCFYGCNHLLWFVFDRDIGGVCRSILTSYYSTPRNVLWKLISFSASA